MSAHTEPTTPAPDQTPVKHTHPDAAKKSPRESSYGPLGPDQARDEAAHYYGRPHSGWTLRR